jgi:hypothetical protein
MFNCRSHSEALQIVFSMLHQGKYYKDKTVQESISELNRNLELLSQHEMPELGSRNLGPIKALIQRGKKIIKKRIRFVG